MRWEAILAALNSVQFYSITVFVAVFALLYVLARILTSGLKRMFRRIKRHWNVGRFWG
jgi:hypothetical protein